MSAIVGQPWKGKTYKELLIQYETVLLESWSHTATIRMSLAGKKVKFTDLHPYLSKGTGSSSVRIKLKPQKMFKFQKYRDGRRVSILDELMV